MKILVLTRYTSLGSSSRYRIFQFLPYLKSLGWDITVHSLLNDKYIHFLYEGKTLPIFNIIKNYFLRFVILLKKRKYDIIWLQQEAFPWSPSWIETLLLKSKTPLVVDHDDAFFHRYDLSGSKLIRKLLGNKIDATMKISDVVIVGNEYLADRARKNKCKNIQILPTVIDINKYQLKEKDKLENELFIIGWVGSPPNTKYVKNIENELAQFCFNNRSRLILIGSGQLDLKDVPYEVIEWNEKTEVNEIQKFDVGIMPLIDNPWERGKCGFKLIQYMACAIPVIASPVGINKEIVTDGVNGFLAYSNEDWIKYLNVLKNDIELRKQMGVNGLKLVKEKFTLQVNEKLLADIFIKLK